MAMGFVPEWNVYRGWLPDGVEIEVSVERFLSAPVEKRDNPCYWDEWISDHCDCFDASGELLAFAEGLSQLAQDFLAEWLFSPWFFDEMVRRKECQERAELVVQELMAAGYVRFLDGAYYLDGRRK